MAKPFKFRLERVLDYRRQLEDEAVALLAKAQAEHDQQESLTNGIIASLEQHRRQGIKKDGTADDVWLFRQYETGLEQDLSTAREKLARLALNLQKCRQIAVERSKERKLLETLKEKESKRYYHEANRQEQKEFDEQAIFRGTKSITKILLVLLVLAVFKLALLGALGVEKMTQSFVSAVTPVAGVEVAQAQTEAMAQTAAPAAPADPQAADTTAEKPANMDESDWKVLKKREEELAAKERSLKELESQLGAQLVEIEKRNDQLRKLLADVKTVEDERMQKLIKAYANMKAKSAAAVLETMDQELAVKILAGLGGRQAGEILGFVETRKAALLSERLTTLRVPFEQ